MSGMVVEAGYTGAAGPVAERIASAFSTLAVAEWLVPEDADERRRLMAGQFEMLIGTVLAGHGHVDVASDDGELVGVAVWFDYSGDHVPDPPGYDERLAELCGPHLPRFQALDEAFAHCHPEAPHQHLAFCAVDADRQGRGIGTMLLQLGLDRLDKTGTAGYLEAANRPLTDWYGRHGFGQTGALQLPDGPAMYPMWRDPFRELAA